MAHKKYQHQIDLINRNPHAELLCWGTGTGKSFGSIGWASNRTELKVLVVCPKALKENWGREIAKYATGNKEWLVLSKEEFKRDHLKIGAYPILIVDEAHYFFGMRGYRKKSQMAKALLVYCAKHDPHRLLLTATPYLSTPWNIYMAGTILGKQWSYSRFQDAFFVDRPMGMRTIKEPRRGIEANIATLVNKIGSTVSLESAADVPDQVFDTEWFKCTKEQEKAKDESFEVNPIVRFTRHHQIENGALKSDGFTEERFFKHEKLDRIIDICTTNKKVAVVCRYNLQIDQYVTALSKLNKKVLVIRGATKDRDSVVQEAEGLNEVIVLINASCSEGYELPSIGVCVFASLSFSYKDYKQMVGRFLRINKLKKNLYLHLVCDGVDQAVYEAIKSKQDFDIAIYAERN